MSGHLYAATHLLDQQRHTQLNMYYNYTYLNLCKKDTQGKETV